MWSNNILIRAVCGESSVMFIEGVPPLPCEIVSAVRRLRKKRNSFSVSVLPSRCKSGWHSPPKSYSAVLALCVVRTLLFAGRRMEQAG